MSIQCRQFVPFALAFTAVFAVAPLEARALNVVYEGVTYDLEIYSGSYDSNPSYFALPVDGGRMRWWGNPTLASALAGQVLGGLSPIPYPPNGPLFATAFHALDLNAEVTANFFDLTTIGSTDLVSEDSFARGSRQTYVVEATPVPAPVPILATAIGFTATQQLRRLSARLRRHRSKGCG